jgi:hypothetical protein
LPRAEGLALVGAVRIREPEVFVELGVCFGQSWLPQKNRRTASRISTRWPPAGASASRRP